MSVTRREALRTFAAAALAAPAVLRGRHTVRAQSPRGYPTRVVDLVRESLVVDMLHQVVYRIDQQATLKRWLYEPGGFTAADYDQYRRTGITVISFGHGSNTFDHAVRTLAEYNGFVAAYPQWLMRVGGPEDFALAKASGRIGILFGFQNGAHFRSPDDVDVMFGLGQRSSQLTYNPVNALGGGAFAEPDPGLSELGHQVVARMNQAGMVVDMAHAGDRTMADTFRASTQPVIISHGNCRALDEGHPRCVSDENIRAMAATGGVMGINFISFMVKRREPTTVDDVVDHIDYAAKLVGIEHVGMGSDLGLESNDHADPAMFRTFMSDADPRYRVHAREVVEGLDGPLRVYTLTEALVRRGYSNANIRLILGENFRRVLSQVWSSRTAAR